jgi:hypothetical protein
VNELAIRGAGMIELFENNNLIFDEWKDMPEFVQEKQEPFAKIIIRFETKENLEEFAKLINQKLTKKTKSIWFPFKSHWGLTKKRWVDEP